MAAGAELEDQQTRQPCSRQRGRGFGPTPQHTRQAVDRRSHDPRPCGRRDEPGRHSRLDGHAVAGLGGAVTGRRAAALDLVHVGRGEPQARSDLFGRDLDL